MSPCCSVQAKSTLRYFFYLYSKARSKHGVYLAYSIHLAYLVDKLREPIRRHKHYSSTCVEAE